MVTAAARVGAAGPTVTLRAMSRRDVTAAVLDKGSDVLMDGVSTVGGTVLGLAESAVAIVDDGGSERRRRGLAFVLALVFVGALVYFVQRRGADETDDDAED